MTKNTNKKPENNNNPEESGQENNENNIFTFLSWINKHPGTFFLTLIVIAGLSASIFDKDDVTPTNSVTTPTKIKVPLNPQKTAPKSGTNERLSYEINKRIVGKHNVKVNIDQHDNFNITFNVSDSLTNSMTKSGAKIDIKEILISIKASGLKYSGVKIKGYMQLVDKFGNSSVNEVLEVSYGQNKIDKINVRNFSHRHVYDIANTVWVHSVLQ